MELRVNELIDLLIKYRDGAEEEGRESDDLVVHIGDQLEAGPYEHYPVGGIWISAVPGKLILVAHPDEEPEQEPTTNSLLVLWKPSDL